MDNVDMYDECMECITGMVNPCSLYRAGKCYFTSRVDAGLISNTCAVVTEMLCERCKCVDPNEGDYPGENCSDARHVFCAGIALTCGHPHGR